MPDIFDQMAIDRHAFRYFGIIRFRDIPGYFPQLGTSEQQNTNLKSHVGAVLDDHMERDAGQNAGMS